MLKEFPKTQGRKPIKPNGPTGGGQAVATGDQERPRKPKYTIISRVYELVWKDVKPTLSATQQAALDHLAVRAQNMAEDNRVLAPKFAKECDEEAERSRKQQEETRRENNDG